MRTYHRNSPQAAARIVTLAMVSDGRLNLEELELLARNRVHAQLGLSEAQFHDVTNNFCEDMLAKARSTGSASCNLDPETVSGLLDEIDDPVLRMKVLRCCILMVDADKEVAPGESVVLLAAIEQWGLRRQLLPVT